MFKDKKSQSTKSKPATEVKMVIISVNIVDVNVTTRSKTSEKKCLNTENQGKTNL
jgi:hypothetical protein